MVYCAAMDIGKSRAASPMSKDFFFIIDVLDVTDRWSIRNGCVRCSDLLASLRKNIGLTISIGRNVVFIVPIEEMKV